VTPQNERRKTNFLSWVVPALLAVITGLIIEGGASIIDIMRAQANSVVDLRKDFNEMQIQVAHLEDAINDFNNRSIVVREPVPKPIKPVPDKTGR
jgi:hypothetical protein